MAETKKIKKPKPQPSYGDGKSTKAQLREIELEKARVELASLRLDLELDESRAERDRVAHEWNRHGDRGHGVFRLETGVGQGVVDLAAEIAHWARVPSNHKRPLTLYITSPGGNVIAGFALYDQLRTLSGQGHPITTVIRGYAASMAGVLFLAGDTRLIGAESFVHIHEISSMTYGKLFEMKDDIAFSERLNKKIEDLYSSRTKIKRAEFRKKSQKTEWWIAADEAIDLGIAHEIG